MRRLAKQLLNAITDFFFSMLEKSRRKKQASWDKQKSEFDKMANKWDED